MLLLYYPKRSKSIGSCFYCYFNANEVTLDLLIVPLNFVFKRLEGNAFKYEPDFLVNVYILIYNARLNGRH